MDVDVITEEALECLAAKPRTVHLFANNPGRNPGVEDFEEVEGVGYEPVTVTGEVVGGEVVYDPAVFVLTGAFGRIWGWFATTEDGRLLKAEEFTKTVVIGDKGGRITINMSI